jgi:putative transposase
MKSGLVMAVNPRQPPQGLVFHSDLGWQSVIQRFRHLLKGSGIRASMGDLGACWDNAVVEHFFESQNTTGYSKWCSQDVTHEV